MYKDTRFAHSNVAIAIVSLLTYYFFLFMFLPHYVKLNEITPRLYYYTKYLFGVNAVHSSPNNGHGTVARG